MTFYYQFVLVHELIGMGGSGPERPDLEEPQGIRISRKFENSPEIVGSRRPAQPLQQVAESTSTKRALVVASLERSSAVVSMA